MENYMVYTPEAHIAITEVYAENGVGNTSFMRGKLRWTAQVRFMCDMKS